MDIATWWQTTLMRVAAVWFDLDGTLRTRQPDFVDSFYAYALQKGVENCPQRKKRFTRWTHYYWAQSPELLKDQEQFPIMDENYWIHYAGRSLQALDCPPECARELAPEVAACMDELRQGVEVIIPHANETLQSLQQAGLRLALLTNRNQLDWEHLAGLGLFPDFELTLAAGELAAWKPDPLIFQVGLERMGLQAEQVVYVGDNYYADVVGAVRAGIQPVLYDPGTIFEDPGCPVISSLAELQPR